MRGGRERDGSREEGKWIWGRARTRSVTLGFRPERRDKGNHWRGGFNPRERRPIATPQRYAVLMLRDGLREVSKGSPKVMRNTGQIYVVGLAVPVRQ